MPALVNSIVNRRKDMSDIKRDHRAIDELHRRDMQAAVAGDFDALRSLIDDEAVMLPPGGKLQRGAAELDASFAKMRSAPRTHEVLEYNLEFEEVQVFGDLAVEWGSIQGTTKEIATGQTTQSRYHVMRMLRRQSNGDWKVYRSIWAPAGD